MRRHGVPLAEGVDRPLAAEGQGKWQRVRVSVDALPPVAPRRPERDPSEGVLLDQQVVDLTPPARLAFWRFPVAHPPESDSLLMEN